MTGDFDRRRPVVEWNQRKHRWHARIFMGQDNGFSIYYHVGFYASQDAAYSACDKHLNVMLAIEEGTVNV